MRRSHPVAWEDLRVGLLILVGLAILAVGFLFVGRTGAVFGERYRLVVLMESAAGLVPGGAVHLAGQTVGQVAEIRLIPPEERASMEEDVSVAVWLSINRRVQPQIRADSRARVRTQGLLGDKIIDISPGSADAAILQSRDTLQAMASLDYQRLLGEAEVAVNNLTAVTRDLADLMDGLLGGEGTVGQLLTDPALYGELVRLSASMDTLVTLASSRDGALGRLLRDEEVYHHMVSTTAALDTVTRALAAGEGTLGRMLRSDSLYVDLAAAAGRADSLLALVQAGKGTAGRLVTEDAVYEELLRSLVDLNAVLADIRERPRYYIPPITIF